MRDGVIRVAEVEKHDLADFKRFGSALMSACIVSDSCFDLIQEELGLEQHRGVVLELCSVLVQGVGLLSAWPATL